MIFVCENCNCIDSTLNINPNVNDTKYPNMTLSDMRGEGNRSINILDLKGYQNYLSSGEINRVVIDPDNPARDLIVDDFEPLMYKFADMVLMLCSECNAGVWTSSFEKLQATEDILHVSRNDLYKEISSDDDEINLILNYIKNKGEKSGNINKS